jgi:hypothetical protein
VEEHRSLPDGEDPEPGQGFPAEGDRVPAAEDVGVADALQVAVYSQTAIVAGGEPGLSEDFKRCDPDCQNGQVET